MSIIVNPHDLKEEQALLAFLDSKKYDYKRDDESILLSEAQQQEILDRDREFEAGDAKTYSLDEIVAYFNIKDK